MKEKIKIAGCMLFISLILTGCGSNIKCNATFEDTIKYNVKITANVKKNEVTNAVVKMKFKNSEDASNMCDLNKLSNIKKASVSCYEKEVIIKNYENIITSDGKTKITKDEFIKNLKAQGFKC